MWPDVERCASREDLAALAVGVGAELGVAAGEFSATLIERGKLTLLYSVDRWTDHHDQREMMSAVRRLWQYGERSRIIRDTFAAAARQFPGEFLDFIYVDGYAHTGQEGGDTLRQWWPKLKPGGIFAGHDYCERYRPTMDAVDAFAREHGLRLHVTREECYPSWVTVKP